MAYYDQIVQNPRDASRDFARRRGLPPDGFEQHVDELLKGEGHLTLGDVQAFHLGRVTPEISEHLDGCGYCQSLTEALSPEAVDNSLNRALEALKTSEAGAASAVPAVGSVGGKYKFPMALAASFVVGVLAMFLAPWSLRDRDSRAELQLLQAEVSRLVADTSKLRTDLQARDVQVELMKVRLNPSFENARVFTLTSAQMGLVQNFKTSWVVEQKRESPDGIVELKLRPETADAAHAAVQATQVVSEGDSILLGSVDLGSNNNTRPTGVQR